MRMYGTGGHAPRRRSNARAYAGGPPRAFSASCYGQSPAQPSLPRHEPGFVHAPTWRPPGNWRPSRSVRGPLARGWSRPSRIWDRSRAAPRSTSTGPAITNSSIYANGSLFDDQEGNRIDGQTQNASNEDAVMTFADFDPWVRLVAGVLLLAREVVGWCRDREKDRRAPGQYHAQRRTVEVREKPSTGRNRDRKKKGRRGA
jgi:hypothetical protein